MRKLITLLAIIVPFLVSCKHEVYYEITTKVQPDGAGSVSVSPSSDQVQEGSSVTFTAKPNGEYIFTGWSGSLSGTENPKTVTVSSNLNVVANFTLRSYPLSVSVEGEGSVIEKVISTKAEYTSGTTVELTAQPAEHWLFDHWESDIQGDKNPEQITVTSAKSVKAVFVKKMYDLTVETQGEGAVSEKVMDTKSSYQEGTLVELVAQPSGHWLFDHWEGDLTGSNNPVRITVSSSKKVKAVFVEKMYPLTVEVEGNGAVNEKVISTKSGTYQEGTVVELSANPGDHWLFDHWEGDLAGKDNTAQITVTSAKTVKAVFVSKDFDLTIQVKGKGVVQERVVETKSAYQEGTVVELTAKPNEFWVFDHWEGDITGNSNPVTVTISDASTVVAVFVEHDPGIQFTQASYVSPQEFYERLGWGFNLCCHLSGFRPDASRAQIPGWVNESTLDEMMTKIVEMGAKTVRLQTTFCGEMGPAPDFLINEDWLEKIDMYIDVCERHGLIFILDIMHEPLDQSLYPNPIFFVDFEGASLDPDIYEYESARNEALWRQLARRYRDRGDFLIFEPFNEPATHEDVSSFPEVLNRLNQEFVNVVRSTGGNNATRWLSIPGWWSNATDALTTLTIPQDYVSNNRITVPFHYYGGLFNDEDWTEWGHTATLTTPDIWNHDEEYVNDLFSQMKRKFIDHDIPVVLGETGCFNGENDRQFAYELYYLEYLFRCASLHLMPALLHTIDGPRYYEDGSGVQSVEGNYGFYDFERKYYRSHGKEIEALINKAFYSTDPDYTLEYIYQNAPYQDEVPGENVEFEDETLRTYLLSQFDRDANGMLSYSEVMRISLLNLSDLRLKTIPDIRKLPSLYDFTCCGTEGSLNVLESLDVSNNKELCNLNVECANLRELILNNSKLTALTCRSNHLTRLDLSKTPNITFLRCFDNPVTELNVTCLSQLEWIDCCGMLITSLDLSGNPKLKELRCHTNGLLSLDLSKNPELTYIDCYSTQIATLDVSNNPKLEALHAWDCPNLSVIYLKTGQSIPDLQKDEHTRIEYK